VAEVHNKHLAVAALQHTFGLMMAGNRPQVTITPQSNTLNLEGAIGTQVASDVAL
jgi:hypothetical protein